MRFGIPAILLAVSASITACVEVNTKVGENFIPENQQYTIIADESFPINVDMQDTDSLSGFSSKRFALGAINDGEEYGTSSRSCVLTLVPFIRVDAGDEGTAKVVRFRLTAGSDSCSVSDKNQMNILQNVSVYGMKTPISAKYNYDCNADISDKVDWSKKICRGTPVINGTDSLVIDFTKEYAEKYLTMTEEDMKSITAYTSKFPGIYLETNKPVGKGGRFNFFNLQLGFDVEYYSLEGNYAELIINAKYNGVQKDSAFYFYFCPKNMFDVDSLLNNGSAGSLPQSCLNLTKHDGPKVIRGESLERLPLSGGGGLKPHIYAKALKDSVEAHIRKNGHNPEDAIICRAQLFLPYEKSDSKYELMYQYPRILSPTVRYHAKDTTEKVTVTRVSYGGLTDASNSSADQGIIDRSMERYSPEITYHIQELISITDKSSDNVKKAFNRGDYDIWLLIMAYETTTTTTAGDDDLSEYYTMLAYQSYYNNMYSGYSSYGDSYSNYYSYMMAAQYAGSSSTSTSVSTDLDPFRYYNASLCGPKNKDRRPKLVFSYAIPNHLIK